MARDFRDSLPWSGSLEWLSPAIVPGLGSNSEPRLPTWIQPEQPPMRPDFKLWDPLIRGVPEADQSPPFWIRNLRPLPDPGPNPFPNPAPLPQPRLLVPEADPPGDNSDLVESSDPARGLLGLLEEAIRGEARAGVRSQRRPRLASTQTISMHSAQPVRRLVRM
jgi:hypothetical protein